LPVADPCVVRRALMGGMSTNRGPVRNLPRRFEYARLRVGKSRTVGVFGSLAHCWVLRQQDIGHPCGGARWTLFRLSRAWPTPYTLQGCFPGCACGGCDGVVVWELHSGREHLVNREP